MLAILERLLKLEADDSGIPEAEFKLGYLLSLIDSHASYQTLKTDVLDRIQHLEKKLPTTIP